jgi:hypothetical protein
VGALLRGGMTRGPLYHRNNTIYGQAHIDAYDLETQVARVPRIVVAPGIREDWLMAFEGGKWFPVLKDMILQDRDGMDFLDLFHFPAQDSIDKGTFAFIEAAGRELSTLVCRRNLNLSAWSKGVWLARQYNASAILKRCNLPLIQIPRAPIQ